MIYVGFFLGYDFTQIFKTMPEDRAKQVFDNEAIEKRKAKEQLEKYGKNRGRKRRPPPFPAEITAPDGTRWQFDLLPPMRRLKIRPRPCLRPECDKNTRCKHVSGLNSKKYPWMWICDAGPFFNHHS